MFSSDIIRDLIGGCRCAEKRLSCRCGLPPSAIHCVCPMTVIIDRPLMFICLDGNAKSAAISQYQQLLLCTAPVDVLASANRDALIRNLSSSTATPAIELQILQAVKEQHDNCRPPVIRFSINSLVAQSREAATAQQARKRLMIRCLTPSPFAPSKVSAALQPRTRGYRPISHCLRLGSGRFAALWMGAGILPCELASQFWGCRSLGAEVLPRDGLNPRCVTRVAAP